MQDELVVTSFETIAKVPLVEQLTVVGGLVNLINIKPDPPLEPCIQLLYEAPPPPPPVFAAPAAPFRALTQPPFPPPPLPPCA